MRPKLLSKRNSCPVLEAATASKLGPRVLTKTDQTHDERKRGLPAGKEVPGSSKVMTEIRSAIRAITKTNHNGKCGGPVRHSQDSPSSHAGSDHSDTLDWNQHDGAAIRPPDIKAFGSDDSGTRTPTLLQKGKEITQRAFSKRSGVDTSGKASNATVVVRGSLLKRRTSLQAMPSNQSPPLSEPVSSVSSIGSSGKSLAVDNISTRKTSVDSRFSEPASGKGTPRRRRSRRSPWSKSSPDGGTLQTIEERMVHPQPTILTVEKVSAAKIYLETYFHKLLNRPNSRKTRHQYLESQLFYSPHLSHEERAAFRRSFYRQEACHTRESRVLKVQSMSSLADNGSLHVARYEPLKILGRGSFGVVKLVREKCENCHSFGHQVFAMKVIRKSGMIRSCQEGHLRAERDFLVASKGSNWSVAGFSGRLDNAQG